MDRFERLHPERTGQVGRFGIKRRRQSAVFERLLETVETGRSPHPLRQRRQTFQEQATTFIEIGSPGAMPFRRDARLLIVGECF